MTRRILLFAGATVLACGVAYGQELVGAGQVELESALLGGGAIYLPSMGPHSMGYVLNVAATANVDRWFGIEGDFAWAMSRQQALTLYGSASANQRSPNMLFYTGNLVISPAGHHHKFVPYAELGGGAVSVLDTSQTGAFGLAADSTHLAFNVGGGVRWFPMPHWGARGDYRYIGIDNANPPTTPGAAPIRHAQRLYGALVLTF
jgi:opacity protein-like surface antigen